MNICDLDDGLCVLLYQVLRWVFSAVHCFNCEWVHRGWDWM